MNHYFYIINEKKIIDIINSFDNFQNVSVYNIIILKKYLSDLKNISFSNAFLEDAVFRQLNYIKFKSFTGGKFTEGIGYNYYGITIIPVSSLKVVRDSFINISSDEEYRLKDMNISKKQYNILIKNIITLFTQAIYEKKPIIHFGI